MVTLRRKLVVVAAALAVLFGLPAVASAATTVWAVGDGADGPESATTDDQVGAMIGAGPLDGFLYLGDVYSTGTQGSTTNPFREMVWYDDAYGDYKAKSYPTPGNHEWPNRSLGTGYDAYWPQFSSPHHYSFDIGGWHVISLNSEEPAGMGSEQLNWLQSDLAAHPGTCTLAYWHRPRYSATTQVSDTRTIGDDSRYEAFWSALRGRASLALGGHLHNYQRFAPMDGITELVVGTGGENAEHDTFVGQADDAVSPDPRLDAWNDTDFGALKMELEPGRADYEMVKLGGGVLDSGSVACEAKPGATTGAAAPDAPTSADLSGTVDPNGVETTYHFEYGTTTDYGSQTPETSAGAGANPQDAAASLSGLQPQTTYHYRLVATNSLGITVGSDGTFTTPVTLSVSVDSGPSGVTNDRSPTFSFSANEAIVTYQCSIQMGDAVLGDCSGEMTHQPPSPLSDGAYTFQVTARDSLGQSATATRIFTVDTVAPDTTIDSGPGGPTNNNDASFGFSSEPGASFECRLDGPGAAVGSFASCTSAKSFADLADGSYTLRVRATDTAGNTDQSPATRTFAVDTLAPLTTIDSGPGGPTRDRTPTFAFHSSEQSVTFECRVDDAAFASCASPFTAATLGDGSHAFEVRSTDAAGNAGPTATRTFAVDTMAPQTKLTKHPAKRVRTKTGAKRVRFEFSGSDNLPATGPLRFGCRLDGGSFVLCRSPFIRKVKLGSHRFSVRAIDAAGNVDPTPASYRWRVVRKR